MKLLLEDVSYDEAQIRKAALALIYWVQQKEWHSAAGKETKRQWQDEYKRRLAALEKAATN